MIRTPRVSRIGVSPEDCAGLVAREMKSTINGSPYGTEIFWERYTPSKTFSTGPEFLLAATYPTHLGGHWVGYLGRTDGVELPESSADGLEFPTGIPFHKGKTCSFNAGLIAEMNCTTTLAGFDTAHRGDKNIGPDGSPGMFPHYGLPDEVVKTWTKDEVFVHLRETAFLLTYPPD